MADKVKAACKKPDVPPAAPPPAADPPADAAAAPAAAEAVSAAPATPLPLTGPVLAAQPDKTKYGCSKCRYSEAGCLACNASKAMRYANK